MCDTYEMRKFRISEEQKEIAVSRPFINEDGVVKSGR